MDRRGFLIRTLRDGAVLVVLPAAWVASGCGSSGGPAQQTAAPADSFRFTSDVTGGHTHDFFITRAQLAQPPSGGIMGDTTAALNHHHVVTLTQDELTAIQAGQAISKPTSVVDGHLHTFKFQLSTADDGGVG